MTAYPQIILKKGKEKSVLRKHPWIFSGAISSKTSALNDGDIVEVFDNDGHYLATGHFQPNTIAVRIFSFERRLIDFDFWYDKLSKAIAFRHHINLPNTQTNMYRLVNGEGDGLPGLIIDVYGQYAVIQIHSFGMYQLYPFFTETLTVLLPNLKAIFLKTASENYSTNTNSISEGWVWGNNNELIIAKENDILFNIDVENGQKTGFFLDQRDNRELVGKFSFGRYVLNMFSYSGGFSLYALKNGAAHVDSVDISQKAINLVDENVKLLGSKYKSLHNSVCEDVFAFLEKMPHDYYDLVVLDPPAFAKHHRVKEQGIKGYRNINKKTIEKIKKGGFLFTFSCSQAISSADFQTLVFSAAAMAGRDVRVVHHLQHATCHPVNIFHPEGEYLKGLMLEIE